MQKSPKFSKLAWYIYFIVALALITVVTIIFGLRGIPPLLTLAIAVILGLLVLIPVTSMLERISKGVDGLRFGKTVLPAREAWLNPLSGLERQIVSLNTLNADVDGLRKDWVSQIEKGAAQQERNRLARELHDSIKQQLFSIQMSAAGIQERWENDPAGAQQALADLRSSAQEALAEMNALLLQLSPAPLERMGLEQALGELCEALQYRSNCEVTCRIEDLPGDDQLRAGWQECVFRMVQEAVSNIARHARASKVSVSLSPDHAARKLILKIEDNGQGFDLSTVKRGQGLNGIIERAAAVGGQAQITSNEGRGTVITVYLPFLEEETEDLRDVPFNATPNKIALNAFIGGVGITAILTPLVLLQSTVYFGVVPSPAIFLWLALAVFLLVFSVRWSVMHSIPSRDRSTAILHGALTGMVAGIVGYGLVLAASFAMQGMDALLNYGLKPAAEQQTIQLITDAVLGVFSWIHGGFGVLILACAGLGAIGGLLANPHKQSGDHETKTTWHVLPAFMMASASIVYLAGSYILPFVQAAMIE